MLTVALVGVLVIRLGVVQFGASVRCRAWARLLLVLMRLVTLKLSRRILLLWLMSMPLGPRL